MRIGIPEQIMPFPFMRLLKEQLSGHAKIEWLHQPITKTNPIMLSEGDACQPFKSMVRDSVALLPDVDLLLVPRLVKLDGHLMCPNFRALPDIVKLNSDKIYPELSHKLNDTIIDISTDDECRNCLQGLLAEILKITIPIVDIDLPARRESILSHTEDVFPKKTIALLGHPYLLENSQLNMGIIRQLKQLGYAVTTPDDIPFTDLDTLAKKGDYYAKTNYWRSSRETLGAFHYYTTIKRPAGIIYLISFNCGVDALMRIELMSLQQKLDKPLPFMVLVGDEHTQQEHTATRLEAYLDIIDGM